MTTDENKALVTRFVRDVLQDLRTDAVEELLSDDFESHTWGFQGDQRQGLRDATKRMAMIAERVFVIDDLIAEGDRVAARLTSSGRPTADFHGIAPTGRRYTIGEIHIVRVAGDKIAEHWHYFDGRSIAAQLKGAS